MELQRVHIYGSDLMDKVVQFLVKFKSVGDLVASIDPVRTSLSWTGVRAITDTLSGKMTPQGNNNNMRHTKKPRKRFAADNSCRKQNCEFDHHGRPRPGAGWYQSSQRLHGDQRTWHIMSVVPR
jgi:hypothetical protein